MIIRRNIEPMLLALLSFARVVCVLGPRQAGKSTLVTELTKGPYPADIFQLDLERVRLAADNDPDAFIAGISTPAVIDEIQRVPKLLLAIKARVDADTSPGQFILTGSAGITTLPTVADALPGRVEFVRLDPFSQGELLGREEDLIGRLFTGNLPVVQGADIGRRAYAETVVVGGYPDAQHRTARVRDSFFSSYLDSVLGRDLVEIASPRRRGNMLELLRLIAARTGGLMSYSDIASPLAINYKTVRAHCDILENVFLAQSLMPWYQNFGQRTIKAPKYYLNDSGLLAHLLGADENRVVDDDGVAGMLFETFVINEFMRQSRWTSKPARFYFFRDQTGREIDLIIERANGDVVGVEIKSTSATDSRDFKALRYLRDRLGPRFKAGVVVTTGSDTIPYGDRLHALPLVGLWQG